MPKPPPAHGKKQRRPHTLGLAKFADAKSSTYDKQARKQKERALNSKVVNKYRKLKARLEGQGGGAPPQAAHAAQQQQVPTPHPTCLRPLRSRSTSEEDLLIHLPCRHLSLSVSALAAFAYRGGAHGVPY